jgi:hypothetical protein
MSLISARRAFAIFFGSLRISSDFGNAVYGHWFWLSDGLLGPYDIRPLKAPVIGVGAAALHRQLLSQLGAVLWAG